MTAKKTRSVRSICLSDESPLAQRVAMAALAQRVAMAEERIRRRLAAIMVADVVGYARLMEADEAGTLAALKDRRKTVLEPVVRSHGGRIVKLMGDGVLVEFGSAVDAVSSALELQAKMAEANDDLADERRIALRIGINLGDVIGDGADVYGEGVNIAARLEALAQPGSVCVSQNVYEQVARKVDGAFEPLGERQLKNIETPVRAYLVRPALVPPSKPAATSEKPSIAVLPFDNMSGDPAQDYFSDGITEDIITELSRFRELMVIARNSSFAFRGKSLDAKEAGHRLGADFIVEGSVRRAGKRVRVSAQLIEVASGKHRWAERYDRNIEDIFAVQDEVVSTIVGTLVGRVASSGAEQSGRKPAQLWAAHDYFLQGRERSIRFDGDAAAPLLRRAIELDPAYAQAYGLLAEVAYILYSAHGRREDLEEGFRAAQKAVELDPLDSASHRALGLIHSMMRQYELGGIHLDRAVALNPNDVHASTFRGLWLALTGHGQEALRSLDADLRRNPFPPAWYWGCRGAALLQLRRHAEALEAFQHVDHLHWWLHCYIASCQAHLGQIDQAKRSAADALRLKPDFAITDFARSEWWRDRSDLEHITDGMRKAGLK
ncbi:adenylate/guanylate cyclase domain-containing protein [Mesorhizobium mediterraneum]|uniref:adenylate/guanylate cyclase domain-containing protein n=1 Tax=Mesorhizobium mediterraneum TaxID=43617 RepID=UPI00177DE50E|nr:adenylate/guanylate cyclase domain-containing protein [Mesorhizobium mediterraneum]